MTLLSMLGISEAMAAGPGSAAPGGGLTSFLPMILVFFVGAYFLMIRPQNKRVKAHRKLVSDLSKGDEIVTVGGMIGKISKMTDEFLTIAVADNVEINVQKAAVANVLPKGTMKSID
jgi:preprotein translocase subunit YajC